MNKTILSLWAGCSSILLAFLVMSGSTYALFYDRTSVSDNRIASGILSGELLIKTADGYVPLEDGSLFGETEWMPGEERTAELLINNSGNMGFSYTLTVNIRDTDPDDDVNLMDVMEYSIGEDWLPIESEGEHYITLRDICTGTIGVSDSNEIAFSLRLRETPGTEYLGKGITVDLYIMAEQVHEQ